jgi:copper(I)-binding protein
MARKERFMRVGLRAVAVPIALMLLISVAGGTLALAQEKRITASDGWVKLPAAGETQAMAFANFQNTTMYDVYLKSASADVAGKAELRDASLSGDAARKPVEFATVPPQDWLYMSPKGSYIALLDLKGPLKEGDKVTLTLTTEQGESLQVSAVVKKE